MVLLPQLSLKIQSPKNFSKFFLGNFKPLFKIVINRLAIQVYVYAFQKKNQTSGVNFRTH